MWNYTEIKKRGYSALKGLSNAWHRTSAYINIIEEKMQYTIEGYGVIQGRKESQDGRNHRNILKRSFVWDGPWHLGRFFKVGCMKEKEMLFRHKDGICKSMELRGYVSCSQGREQSLYYKFRFHKGFMSGSNKR